MLAHGKCWCGNLRRQTWWSLAVSRIGCFRMVIAYHLIWTAYGFWLPNDLRGSTSRAIRNDVLKELGEIHFGRKRLQPRSVEVRAFMERASLLLKHPLLEFGATEVNAIAESFARVIARERYTCYACAIMPDHVHVLIRKHRDRAEEMIAKLQCDGHIRLREAGFRDLQHPVWGGKGWKVFLEDADDIRRTVKYVEENPVKIGQAKQRWGFVTPYDGWDGRFRGRTSRRR
jgi:REP element-mobilizing transposase RayT